MVKMNKFEEREIESKSRSTFTRLWQQAEKKVVKNEFMRWRLLGSHPVSGSNKNYGSKVLQAIVICCLMIFIKTFAPTISVCVQKNKRQFSVELCCCDFFHFFHHHIKNQNFKDLKNKEKNDIAIITILLNRQKIGLVSSKETPVMYNIRSNEQRSNNKYTLSLLSHNKHIIRYVRIWSMHWHLMVCQLKIKMFRQSMWLKVEAL